jgi:hypothetical protein
MKQTVDTLGKEVENRRLYRPREASRASSSAGIAFEAIEQK